MYLEYAYRILNAKIAYFSAQTHPFAIEAAADLYARAPASWRISGKEYDDGWVFILEPKTLATFTPRFHLFADKLASFYEPSRRELFKGSDAAVLKC